MVHLATQDEANALHYLALALRPDWKNNNPGESWLPEITDDRVFQHAENFDHCLRALTAYCHESKDGKYVKRTPDVFPRDGKHWDTTRPATVTTRAGKQPICQDHTAYNAATCPVCADEIRTKHRSPQQRGKRIRQIVPSPGIRPAEAQRST